MTDTRRRNGTDELAQVLDVKRANKRVKYFVHFHGWKATHDAWVEEVLPINEETLEEKTRLEKAAKDEARRIKTERARKRRELNRTISQSVKRPRPSGDAASESESAAGADGPQAGLRLMFPALLKKQLFDDFERVTLKKQLVKLPRRVTVENIFDDFLGSATQPFGLASATGRLAEETAREVLDGLQVFFDRALGPFLLYSFERLQFEAIREKHPEDENDHLIIREAGTNRKRRRLSQLYGAEHLLRFLIRLPDLVKAGELLAPEEEVLQQVLNGLLKFISKNRDRYLGPGSYALASADYLCVIQDL